MPLDERQEVRLVGLVQPCTPVDGIGRSGGVYGKDLEIASEVDVRLEDARDALAGGNEDEVVRCMGELRASYVRAHAGR